MLVPVQSLTGLTLVFLPFFTIPKVFFSTTSWTLFMLSRPTLRYMFVDLAKEQLLLQESWTPEESCCGKVNF